MTAAWQPELARFALEAPAVAPLRLPGWDCEPYDIQTRGVAWLFATPRAVLGDVTGTGKTVIASGLLALMAAKGELGGGQRAVVVVLEGTAGQWRDELARFNPGLRVATTLGRRTASGGYAPMNRAERRRLYADQSWDVLVTTYAIMWRDATLLAGVGPTLTWFDESSSIKNSGTRAAGGARALASASVRVVCATATAIENNLVEFFAQLEVLGLAGGPGTVFGTEEQFKARHCIYTPEVIFVKGGRQRTKMTLTGYRNVTPETTQYGPPFTELVAPYYLRRTEGSADMPEVVPEDVWVPMRPDQREWYEAIADGRSAPGMPRDLSGPAKLMNMLQAASSTAALGGDDLSGKLDWLMAALASGRFGDEKVVVFCRFLGTVGALRRRLAQAGIGHASITGPENNAQRDEARQRFWADPACRVMILTTAGGRGLNLQVARYGVMVDFMFNPAVAEQFVGRLKRSGSAHSHVFVVRLLTPDSIEEGMLRTNVFKQVLADAVNGDVSELFGALSEQQQAELLRWGATAMAATTRAILGG